MKDRTFKNFIISLCLAYTLILLTGCGGGGGGSTSGGFGYIATNNINTDSTDNISSNNNSSDNNSSDNNSSDNNSSDNNSSDNNSSNDDPVDNTPKISLSFTYQGETKDVRMKLGQSWKIDTSKAKSIDSITINPNSGAGDGEFIKITIPENTTNSPKNIKIPVTNSEGTEQIANISITQQGNNKKAWLFINYFACDNNLAGGQLDSLNMMEKVGSDDNTHIIAYFDMGNRSNLNYIEKYSDIITEDEWPGGAREFYLMLDNTDKITSPVIKYYQENNTDSANPFVLTEYLLRTIEQYPAEKICINIINHGGAYTGIIRDETNDVATSTSSELNSVKYALEEVYKKTGKKIDLLMFDACLMANFEVAYELKDCVSYIIASEEESLVSILDGLNGSVDYYEFLSETSSSSVLSSEIKKLQKGLKSNINSNYTKITSDYNGLTLAKAILQANKIRRDNFLTNDYCFTNYNTTSIINCSKINNLKNALSDFAEYVKKANETEKEIVKNATEKAIIDYEKDSNIIDVYENIKEYYGIIDEEDKDYVKYKPLGEIYSPSYLKGTINDISYTFSYSEFCVTDLGLIMQKINLSSATELKTKAENVYKALKDVIPENNYYGTEKISLIPSDAYDFSNQNYYRSYFPFGYHKYSNGLSIGWFTYNKNDLTLNNLKVKTNQSFSEFVKSTKDYYSYKSYNEDTGKTYYKLQFYKDCPEWIEMQESLY